MVRRSLFGLTLTTLALLGARPALAAAVNTGGPTGNVAIDFDPGPEGKIGQVINCGRDDEIRHVIADTFTGFLMFVARQFVLGRVSLGADESPTKPRWLAVAGKKQDLLTGLRDLMGLEDET